MATASSQVVSPTVLNVSPSTLTANATRVSSTPQPIAIGRSTSKPSQTVRTISGSSTRANVIPTASNPTTSKSIRVTSRSMEEPVMTSMTNGRVTPVAVSTRSMEEPAMTTATGRVTPVAVSTRSMEEPVMTTATGRVTPVPTAQMATARVTPNPTYSMVTGRVTPNPTYSMVTGRVTPQPMPQALVVEKTTLEMEQPTPVVEKVCVPDTPTTDELQDSGFCPLETIQVYQDDEETYDVYIKALSKDGFKVLIYLDISECAECLLDADGNCIQMVCVEKVNTMPSEYMEACKKCESPYLFGMAYANDSRMNCVCNGEEKHYAIIGDDLWDPHGIFYGDAAPFPIVRLSDIRKASKMVHNCIRAMTQEIVAALLKLELAMIDHSMKDAECLKKELCKYKQTLLSKIGQLNGSVKTLEAIDSKYDNISICPQNQAELLCTRGKVWDNLAHRRLLYGHLISSAAEVASTCGVLHHQMKVIECNQQMLDKKFCDIHNVIEFKRTSVKVTEKVSM